MVAATPGAALLTREIAKQGYDVHLAASCEVWGALLTRLLLPLVCGPRLPSRRGWRWRRTELPAHRQHERTQHSEGDEEIPQSERRGTGCRK